MNYRILGRTGLQVSVVGMGTGGSGDPLGQKTRSAAEIHALLRGAFDQGVNFFDTAPGYMESEVLLGQALQGVPRDRLVICTKIALAGGMPGEPMKVMRADEIEAAVEKSLRRLNLGHIDLLLIGVAGPEYRDLVVNEHLPVLQRLQSTGKVRFLGSSELSRSDGAHAWLQAILPTGRLDAAMVAHNMINQSAQRTVLPLCRQLNLGAINMFTVRRVFGAPGRLEEVIADLKQRGVIAADSVPDRDPLGWVLAGGDAGSLIEAAYRYAAYTPGVTLVMNGSIESKKLADNIRSVHRGPLAPATVARLGTLFGQVAEPVGN